MNLRSLGYRTDLIFARFDSEIIDRGEFLVIRTPLNPTFHWGNYLIFDAPPKEGDFERWRALFAQEIGTPPEVKHIALGWDAPDGATGVIAPFEAAGFAVDYGVILTASAVIRPPKCSDEAMIRPLTGTTEEQSAAVELQIFCREEPYEEEGYRLFRERQMARYAAMDRAGLGRWFGAFWDGKLIGDCGVYRDGDVARFQSVEVHPEYRRRGVCGALIYRAARYALDEMGVKTLVMAADEAYHAAKIYESCGFRPTEKQVGMSWWKRPDTEEIKT